MTVANELRVKHWRAPRRRRIAWWRMRRPHYPSCLRGRRRRLGCDPQQQRGDAGGLRGQRQLAAGDEIELARLTPDFEHHSAERVTGERVRRGAQRGFGVRRAHGGDKTRIEAELANPAHRQRAGFDIGKILPHPYQRPARRDPPREPGDKSGGCRALMAFGKHFMQGGDSEPAAQHRICARVSQRDPVERMRIAGRFDALDAAAQGRKRDCAYAIHAPLPQEF